MTDHKPASPAAGAKPMHGVWVREQRRARGWSVMEMRRRLREAAGKSMDKLPSDECLGVMIRRWEKGAGGVSERYRMYFCRAFGIPLCEFGTWPLPDDGRHDLATQTPPPARTQTTPVPLSEDERAQLRRLLYEYAALATRHDMLRNTIISWAKTAASETPSYDLPTRREAENSVFAQQSAACKVPQMNTTESRIPR